MALGGLLGGVGAGSVIGGATVRLFLDDAQFNAALKQSEAKTGTSTAAMGSSTSRFGAVAAAGFLVAGVAAIKFAADAVQAASDQGEALNKSLVIFGEHSTQVEEWAETGGKAFGLSKTAALDAAAGFGQMLQTAGFAVDESALMSEAMVQLAGDMASFNNIDPTVALEKLRSGLAGEAEPLRQYGVFLSEAAVSQEAYTSGIADYGDALTEAEKVQARYNIILEQTAKQQGDFGRTAESLPNQLRTMRAEFANVSAEVGTALLPAMTSLLGTVIDLIPLLEAAEGVIATFATGLAQIAAALGFGPSLEEVNASTAALVASWQAGNITATQLDEALQRLSTTTYTTISLSDELQGSIDSAVELEREAIDTTDRYTESYGLFAAGVRDAADAVEEQTQTLRELRDLQLAMVDSTFAVINAVRDDQDAEQALANARRELNRLTEAGKEGTKAYEEAQRAYEDAALDAATAQAGLIGAVKDLKGDVESGITTQEDAVTALEAMATQAGLTKAETKLLVDELKSGKKALDDWNRTPMDDKAAYVDIFVKQFGGTGTGQLAAGGIIAGASGFIARGPTFLVGEGSYATPMGRGAEAVLPLDDRTMARLGRVIAGNIRVTPIVVDVSGQVISTAASIGLRRATL